MNRFSNKFAAAALAVVVVLAGVSAQAREKKPKHKKNQDLSANPLANVKSKPAGQGSLRQGHVCDEEGPLRRGPAHLQTLLNTYPDSEYRMRAKLAVGDTWFKEGGTAALTQAEAEYKDFITFFPNAPEAAEAQMKVADIYYQQMEKPDRDYTNAQRAEQEYRVMINLFPDSTLVPRAKQKLRDVRGSSGRARDADRPLLREPARNIPPPSPACRPWSIPIRFTPRATRPCSASAMPMTARPMPCQIAPGCPAP